MQLCEVFCKAAGVLEQSLFSRGDFNTTVDASLQKWIRGLDIYHHMREATNEAELKQALDESGACEFFSIFKDYMLEDARLYPKGTLANFYRMLWQAGVFNGEYEAAQDQYSEVCRYVAEHVERLKAVASSDDEQRHPPQETLYIVVGEDMINGGRKVTEDDCLALMKEIAPLLVLEEKRGDAGAAEYKEVAPGSNVFAIKLRTNIFTRGYISMATGVTMRTEDRLKRDILAQLDLPKRARQNMRGKTPKLG